MIIKEAQGTVRRTVPWASSVHYRIRRGGHWPPAFYALTMDSENQNLLFGIV